MGRVKVQVSYRGVLATLAGVEAEEAEVGVGCTVRDLIEFLVRRHGERFRQALAPGGSRPLMALVAVDGTAVGLGDSLTDGARVLIVKSMGGG